MRSIQLSMLGIAAFFGAVSCGTSRPAAPGEPVLSPSEPPRAAETRGLEKDAALFGPDKARAEYALSEVVLTLGALVDEPFVPIASLAQGGISDMDAGAINPLLDNIYYRKSRELLQEARRLFDLGDYEGCLTLTKSAQEYARLSDEYMTRQTSMSRADKAIEEVESELASVDSAGRSKEPYKAAQAAYGEAKTARAAEDWNSAAEAAERALEALETMKKPAPGSAVVPASAVTPARGTPAPQDPPLAAGAVRTAPAPRSALVPASAVTPARGTPAPQDPPAIADETPAVQARIQQVNQQEAPTQTPRPVGESSVFLTGGTGQSAPLIPSSSPKSAAPETGGGLETPQVPALGSPAAETRPKTRTQQAPATRDTPSVPALAPAGAVIPGARDTPLVAAIPTKPRTEQDAWAPTARVSTGPEGAAPAPRIPPSRPEGPVTAPHIASSLGEEASSGAGLSAQYKVQAWETSMDCLWNIAAKPWVYGDPSKWIFLYRANSSKLPNPQNPHIIPPNIVLDIPSIDGEVRQGLGSWNAP